MNEFVIEWIRGKNVATVTAPSTTKLKNRCLELAQKYPDDVTNFIENSDGSICCHIPVSWVKLRPKMNLTDEQRNARKERLEHTRASAKNFQKNSNADI